jgi:DNA-binding SARP family transcriptional activator/TolB-like protein/Tfp pilus assembly protein PilF
VTTAGPLASLTLFGSFALAVGGRTLALPRKAQALIALLVCRNGEPVEREALADMLWTDRGIEQARQSLRQCLWAIRRSLGDDVIEARRDALSITTGGISVDVAEFKTLADSTVREDLARCVELYRGELLAVFGAVSPHFDEWLAIERQRLAGVAAGALRRLADAHLAAGEPDAAITAAWRLVSFDDLDEDAHRRLMRVLAQTGRRAEALRHYEVCVATLRRELDVAPEPETAALSELIKRGGYASSPRSEDTPPPSQAVNADQDLDPSLRPAPSVVTSLATWRNALRQPYLVSFLAGVCFVAAVLGAVTWKRPILQLPRVAVVPLVNVSSIPDQASPIAGLADLIAEQLQEKQSLRVMQYRNEEGDALPLRALVAADPSVRYIVEGSAAFTVNLSVSIRVVDRAGTELWSEHYDEARSNAVAMVTDIAKHIARGVVQDVEVHQRTPVAFVPTSQDTRDLLALATYVRYRVDGTSNATFRQIAQDVVDHTPNNADALTLVANSYLTDFTVTGVRQNLSEAETRLTQVLQQDPINFNALWDKCSLLRLQGRPADALEVCRRALDINPHHPGTRREIAHDLLELEDAPGAIAWFNAAIAADPTHPFVGDAYKGIALGELFLGDMEAALTALRKSLEHDHRGSVSGLLLAGVLESAGRDAEARSALAEFNQHHPELQPVVKTGANLIPALYAQPRIVTEGLRRLGLTVFTKDASSSEVH